jgi:hypothetical protein
MQTHNAKQDIIETVQGLPDGSNYEEILYRLYVVNKIRQGMQDVIEDRGVTTDEFIHEIEQW